LALVLEALDSAERDFPDYIEIDVTTMKATYLRVPELADVPYPVKMEPNMVVEYYAS
jgi:small subunit ribosomal protein S4